MYILQLYMFPQHTCTITAYNKCITLFKPAIVNLSELSIRVFSCLLPLNDTSSPGDHLVFEDVCKEQRFHCIIVMKNKSITSSHHCMVKSLGSVTGH